MIEECKSVVIDAASPPREDGVEEKAAG